MTDEHRAPLDQSAHRTAHQFRADPFSTNDMRSRSTAEPSVSARSIEGMCFCLDSDAVRCIRARYPLGETDPDDECMCVCHAADPEAGWDGQPYEPDDEAASVAGR